MKMLLVQLPHAGRRASMFPTGIANIAVALNDVGVEAEVLDIFALGCSYAEVSEYLRGSQYDLVGISAYSTQYQWAKWMAAEVKRWRHHAIVIMGGPLATYNAEIVLARTQTDICVISEGEETIKDIVQNLGNLDNVKGICFKSVTGQVVRTSPRLYIHDLDSIPFPRYDLFPVDIYFKNIGVDGAPPRIKAINTLTSRGCPYLCGFCSRTFGSIRLRSIDKVIEEIGQLRDKYGIRAVSFADELVLINKKRGCELCEKIKPLKIYWGCQGRANIVDLDLLRAMKDAGCTSVGYGIESGSQKILDNMKKRTTTRQNELAITNTVKAGMIPIVQMIYGYPGEDLGTIHETLEFFDRVHYYPPTSIGEAWFSLLTPLPGSPLYKELLASGKIINEEEYLLGLEGGYYVGSPLRMNLTKFSDGELLAHKVWLENHVKANYQEYVRKHPLELIQKYIRMISNILNIEGYAGLLREFAWRMHRMMGYKGL